MKCCKCKIKAIFVNPTLCKKHLTNYVENTAFKTIKDYKLINKKDKIIVAASGGKDSLTVLHILNKRYDVEALVIDEGIKNYRSHTITDLEKFCNKEKIKLHKKTFKKEFNKNLDNMKLHGQKPCSVCGTFRRFLLNKYSQQFDVIATGHNLDDEAQAILMNFLKPNFNLTMRIGPKTGSIKDKKFTKRIKPLYFLTEKEIKAYTLINGLRTDFDECPNMPLSFRSKVRDELNEIENNNQGSKKNLVHYFLNLKKNVKNKKHNKINHCTKCGFISKGKICRACQLQLQI